MKVLALLVATYLLATATAEDIGCITEATTETCLTFVNDPQTWSDAWAACVGAAKVLAVPDGSASRVLLRKKLKQLEDGAPDGVEYGVWIAGREMDDSKWRWLQSQNVLTTLNSSTVNYTFSTVGKLFENCASVSMQNGTLNFESALCRKKHAFICQSNVGNQSSTTCTPPSIVVKDWCFSVVKATKTWFEATEMCRANGSKLVELDGMMDVQDLDLFQSQVLGDEKYWVGLNRRPWVWATKTQLNGSSVDIVESKQISSYEWFGDGSYPDYESNNCVSFSASPHELGWKAVNCLTKMPYFCQNTTVRLEAVTGAPIVIAPTSKQNDSVFVIYMLPALLMIGAFILIGVLVTGCYISKRGKGYERQA